MNCVLVHVNANEMKWNEGKWNCVNDQSERTDKRGLKKAWFVEMVRGGSKVIDGDTPQWGLAK
jgi:hypothetical protein